MSENLDRWVDARDGGDLLGMSEAHLRRLRASGDGPPWSRLGNRVVRYRVGDLLDWAKSRSGAPQKPATEATSC